MASLMNDFIKIGPRTSLFTPQHPTSGQLVIICTWLGAAHKHISKYIALYQRIASGARILLVESNVLILISSYVRQCDAIKPAVSAILDTLRECDIGAAPSPNTEALPKRNKIANNDNQHSSIPSKSEKLSPQILLHVFSNGGTNTATQLLIVLNARLQASLPLVGLLCDSCPAEGTYWRSYDAMVLSLPKDLATRFLGALACHCILVLLYTWIACGNENPASLQRRTMLDGKTVSAGWTGEVGGSVCYFYSKEDRMCLWSDVKRHADQARKLGWDVREILFEGSGHCGHFSKDEERYAETEKSIWDGNGSGPSKKEKSKL